MLPNETMDPFFEAVTQATEEAILNAMIAAETMEGNHGHKVYAISHERIREILKKYNRLKNN
jgi:L-aminopeptidase/D-esterase-like protein